MKLMAVLNATPDSFFDQGAHFSLDLALQRGKAIWQEGADLIDVGGVSFRPYAPPVDEKEELRRVIPLIAALRKEVPLPLSIDTNKAEVARQALAHGVSLLNNIGGFTSQEFIEIAASSNVDLCLMHMQGTPQTMQIAPSYPEGVVPHILHFFERQIGALARAGVKEERIILDPGIGFGKTTEHNLTILKNLKEFKKFGLRLLIGASRKSFLGKLTGKPISDLLPATLAAHAFSLFSGTDIIRVHDVAAHRDVMTLLSAL